MLKLIKYELRKTWITKAILLAITAIAEVLYLIGLYGERDALTSTGVLLLAFLAFGGVLVIGLESILTLHRDMNTRQGYMLFMTPNSCYKILGAKVLECGVSILLAGAFYFALGALDITLLLAKAGQLDRLWKLIQEFLTHFSVAGRPVEINLRALSAVTFVLLTGWISFVTTACLADIICAALLNGKKHNGIISFLLFVVISLASDWAVRSVTSPIRDTFTLLTVYGLLNLVLSAVMYVVSARIMDRRLSV